MTVIATAPFGATGRAVTRVGLGGEGVLRTYGQEREAAEVIATALEEGITYFDSARAYSGSEQYLGAAWEARPQDRAGIFQTSKSAERNGLAALAELDLTLANLGTEYLDLWQIHDVRTLEDIRAIESRGGALEAFVEAKRSGRVRAIGVTGHHDPAVLSLAVRNWPVDAVLLPVNPVEAAIGGFLDDTLPAALEKGLAVIAMKVLGASHYIAPHAGITASDLIGYALGYPVTLAVVGCSTPEHVRTLAAAKPLPEERRREIEAVFAPAAGRLAFYRGGV